MPARAGRMYPDPPEMIPTRDPANGGYCRLWDKAETDIMNNAKALVVGSAGTANAVPSLFETYYTAREKVEMLLEHQSSSRTCT